MTKKIDIKTYYQSHLPIEPKVPKDWKKKYPEFCIGELPGPAVVNKEKLKPGTNFAFEYIDDNFIMIDRSDTKKDDLYWGGGLSTLSIIFTSYIYYHDMNLGINLPTVIVIIFCILPSIWFFIKAYFMRRARKIIFDRQRGIVQVPGSFWNPPQLIRFKELHVVVRLMTRFQGVVMLALFKNKNFADKYLEGGMTLPFFDGRYTQSWSFWVWYMDKNRPLPPGTALEPYRQQDYERRKAEGFPEPLHPSYIETPEHFTNEYYLMNEKNKKTPGQFKQSLNDMANGPKTEINQEEYYNMPH